MAKGPRCVKRQWKNGQATAGRGYGTVIKRVGETRGVRTEEGRKTPFWCLLPAFKRRDHRGQLYVAKALSLTGRNPRREGLLNPGRDGRILPDTYAGRGSGKRRSRHS